MTLRQFYDWQTAGGAGDVSTLVRIASLEDTLRGKLKAWTEPGRRPSKRQKDLTDIFRLVEAHPQLRPLLPEAALAKLEEN